METLSSIKSEDQARMIKAAEQVREMSESMRQQAPQGFGQQMPPGMRQQMPQREPDMANMSTEELINIARGQ
jgi:hypothetical protein